MLLGSGLLPHLGIAGGSGLTGATWATDGSGRAYNTPTLGAELLTNVEFTTDVTGWALLTGTTATQRNFLVSPAIAPTGGVDDFGVEILTNGSGGAGIRQQPTIANHTWYEISCRAYWPSVNTGVNLAQLISVQPSASLNIFGEDSWQTIRVIARSTSTAGDVRFRNISGISGDIAYFDAPSLKPLTLTALHAAKLGSANNLIASARINALTAGTQAGTFALVDNPANPQNGIYAYHDGTGVTLEKLVAGAWSTVNARVAVAFSADAAIEIRPLGSNQFDVYYGGVKRGATATISDASIASNLYYGLFSTYSGNTFSEFRLDGNLVPFGF